MAQTLAEFVIETKSKIVAFEKMWLAENAKNPHLYPLGMTNGSEYIWSDAFREYGREYAPDSTGDKFAELI